MTRGSTIIWGKDELTRAPAPDAKHIRRDFNSACAAAHLPPRETRLHGARGKKDHASVAPMMATPVGLREGRLSERSPADHHRAAQSRDKQAVQGGRLSHSFYRSSAQPGSNTPPGLCCTLRSQGLAAEKMTLQSFPPRPFLVQCAIDVVAVLFAFLLVAVTGVGLAFAFYALLFLSF